MDILLYFDIAKLSYIFLSGSTQDKQAASVYPQLGSRCRADQLGRRVPAKKGGAAAGNPFRKQPDIYFELVTVGVCLYPGGFGSLYVSLFDFHSWDRNDHDSYVMSVVLICHHLALIRSALPMDLAARRQGCPGITNSY